MAFITKIDYSDNRQIRQRLKTYTNLSGGTNFGVPFSALTSGPDPSTSAVTDTQFNIVSTFTGTTGTTSFDFGLDKMDIASSELPVITQSNSGDTFETGNVFVGNRSKVIDGNTVYLDYTGVSFDFRVTAMTETAPDTFSGTAISDPVDCLSADTLDYTGSTIWVNVHENLKTDRMIIKEVDSGPGVTDLGVDGDGNVVDQASDIKLKKNIKDIDSDSALDKVKNLRGVYYKWKDERKGGSDRRIGLISQDVEDVVPELTYDNKDIKGVRYKDLPALLIEAIKELSKNSNSIKEKPEHKTEIKRTEKEIETQKIVAEDNNIELNFNGDKDSSLNGGIIVKNGVKDGEDSKFVINENGEWELYPTLKPYQLHLPRFEHGPKSLENNGSIAYDDNFIYVKTSNGWKKSKLEDLDG